VHTDAAENVLPKLGQQFDVITISHVLEHILNPVEILKLIRQSLAPDGVLYVEVPNIPADSLLKYPDHLWAPRHDEPHITFFSIDVLRNMLTDAGFDPCFCDTAGPHYRYISGWQFKMPPLRWLAQELIPKPLFNFLRKQSFTKAVRVQDREESFYQYGGPGIWLRTVSRIAD
jgi:SAM-dependent methyltransferase